MLRKAYVKTLENLIVQTEEVSSRLNVRAVGEVVEVEFRGREIKPYAYDAVGNPLFTKEQTRYMLSEDRNGRETYLMNMGDGNYEFWDFKVLYFSRIFWKWDSLYNSTNAIRKSLKNLEKFRQLTIDRRLAIKAGRELKNFIVNNCILLGKDGRIYQLNLADIRWINKEPVIEATSDFMEKYPDAILEIVLPVYDYCHKCGERFTIEDVFAANVIGGKMHDDCEISKE